VNTAIAGLRIANAGGSNAAALKFAGSRAAKTPVEVAT